MESTLASWQSEIFSDAELSPPISPSPPSPTLYANAYDKSDDCPSSLSSQNIKSGIESCSRAQLASKILRELESEQLQYTQNVDEEMLWTEESVNLELFEDLDDFGDYTRPLTPDSQEFKNQEHQLQLDGGSPIPSPAAEFPSDSFDELSAEFQTILAGLSAQVTTIDTGEVIQIFGLDEIQGLNLGLEYAPVDEENDSDPDYDADTDSNSGSTSSMDIVDDESHTFNDFELQLIGLSEVTNSNINYSAASSPLSPLHDGDPDNSEHTCESILDALLQGDLATAKALIPANAEPMAEIIIVSPAATATTSRPRRAAASSNQKHGGDAALSPAQVKNGRSGTTGMKKPRLPSTTDKVKRKKEQNKTAATRYREKKKLLAAVVSVQEDELEKINDELKAQRDNLHRQLLIYKELLRDVMADRKTKRAISTPSSRVVVSSGGRNAKAQRMR